MTESTPTWASRVRDLRAAGWTLVDVGKRVGLSVSAVSDIGTGRVSEPRGEAAVKLFALHKRVCARARKSAPVS